MKFSNEEKEERKITSDIKRNIPEKKISGGYQKPLPLKPMSFCTRFWAKSKLIRYNILYKLHLKQRLIHDVRYEKGGWYRRWSDKSYSSSIHKATVLAFVISIVVYSITQFHPLNYSFEINLGEVETTSTTAKIKWITNVPSDTLIRYQLISESGDALDIAQIAGNLDLVTNHEVVLKSLRPNMIYRYKVRSISTGKYVSETSEMTFQTKSFEASHSSVFPSSTEISEKNISSTSVKITWLSVVPTTSLVDYGTVPGFYTLNIGINDLSSEHVVHLDNLIPGTKYYYRIRVKDQYGAEHVSKEYSFTAIPLPSISNIKILPSSRSVTISWQTNVPTDSVVNFGQDQNLGQRQGILKLTKDHKITLTNLSDSTKYYYQIVAKDQFKSEVKSDIGEFTTSLDDSNLEVFNVKIDIIPLRAVDEGASVIISYSTSKPATTLVEYGEGISDGYEKKTVEESSLSISHTVIVENLSPSIACHFRIIASDEQNKQDVSKDYTFITPSRERSTLQLIFGAFEETFSWVKKIRVNI